MARFLRARHVSTGDGKFIGNMMRHITPLHNDVLKNVEERLEYLISEGSAIGAIVEQVDRTSGQIKTVGTTLLGFVKDEFVEKHFKKPAPALSSTLLRSVQPGSLGHFMSRKEQARANLGDGMQQAILEFAIDPMDMQHPDFAPVMNELYSSYFKFERGYNIKGVFVEADAGLDQLVLGSGLFLHNHFPINSLGEDVVLPTFACGKRGLYRITREEKNKIAPSSAAFVVMSYIRPTLQFTPAEQRLLSLAIEGLTDQEIALELDVSRDALKQNWRSIYEHVSDVMPNLFANTSAEDQGAGRGLEKRRHVISHVRDNLQELRPHYLRRG